MLNLKTKIYKDYYTAEMSLVQLDLQIIVKCGI